LPARMRFSATRLSVWAMKFFRDALNCFAETGFGCGGLRMSSNRDLRTREIATTRARRAVRKTLGLWTTSFIGVLTGRCAGAGCSGECAASGITRAGKSRNLWSCRSPGLPPDLHFAWGAFPIRVDLRQRTVKPEGGSSTRNVPKPIPCPTIPRFSNKKFL